MTGATTITGAETVTRREAANALRILCADAVEAANSGHPGAPLGMADTAEWAPPSLTAITVSGSASTQNRSSKPSDATIFATGGTGGGNPFGVERHLATHMEPEFRNYGL